MPTDDTKQAVKAAADLAQEIVDESKRGQQKWSGAEPYSVEAFRHDDGHQPGEWLDIIGVKLEAARAETGYYGSRTEYRNLLVEVAGLAYSALAAHDRNVARATERARAQRASKPAATEAGIAGAADDGAAQ